jgi:type II secretory pathway component PulM
MARAKGTTEGGLRGLLGIAGAVSFVVGYILAIVGGHTWPENTGIIGALAIMGVFVGLMNITAREIMPYLIAAIALVLIGTSGVFVDPLNKVMGGLGTDLTDIVKFLAIFTAPAATIVAVRAGISLAAPGD